MTPYFIAGVVAVAGLPIAYLAGVVYGLRWNYLGQARRAYLDHITTINRDKDDHDRY